MKSKYTKKQRVLAILGIILLVGLYLAALIASFFSSPTAQGFFMQCFILYILYPNRYLSSSVFCKEKFFVTR